MRSLNDRIWSDGTRHWYDGMTGGYYMDEGVLSMSIGFPVPLWALSSAA